MTASGHVSKAQFVEYEAARNAMADAIKFRNMGLTDTTAIHLLDLDRNVIVLKNIFN